MPSTDKGNRLLLFERMVRSRCRTHLPAAARAPAAGHADFAGFYACCAPMATLRHHLHHVMESSRTLQQRMSWFCTLRVAVWPYRHEA